MNHYRYAPPPPDYMPFLVAPFVEQQGGDVSIIALSHRPGPAVSIRRHVIEFDGDYYAVHGVVIRGEFLFMADLGADYIKQICLTGSVSDVYASFLIKII